MKPQLREQNFAGKKPFFSFIFLVQVLQNLKMCNKNVLIDEN